MTVPLDSGIRLPADLVEKEKRMSVLQDALKGVVSTLRDCDLEDSVVKTKELVEWKGIPLLVS